MESFNLGGGLSVLRGFFVTTLAATARVLLNVQVKYANFALTLRPRAEFAQISHK
jgi:hypothetical protein